MLVGHPSEEVVEYYGADSPLNVTGGAGTGFVEDPFRLPYGYFGKRNPTPDDGSWIWCIQAFETPLPRRTGYPMTGNPGEDHDSSAAEGSPACCRLQAEVDLQPGRRISNP